VIRIEIEGVTDVLEREDPGVVVSVEPLAGLTEETSSSAIGCEGVSLIAADCFFEDGEHETALALERYRSRFVRHRGSP
jgi:hypothetical protein